MMTRWASVSKNESLARCITARNATVFRFKKEKKKRRKKKEKKKLESSWGEKPGDLASMWCFFDFVVDIRAYFFVMYEIYFTNLSFFFLKKY